MKQFSKKWKSLYTKEDSFLSKEEDNNDNKKQVFFMELIQDENSMDGGKSLVKQTQKPSKKWTYNGIYMSPPKYEAGENSSCTKEYSKSEKNTKSKLQTLSAQFETLRMKEKEYIVTYFLRVDDIMISRKGLGEMTQFYRKY